MLRTICDVKIKSPVATKWEKAKAIFDTNIPTDKVSERTINKLKIDGVVGEEVFIHVKILGEELSWPFQVVKNLEADVLFGEEFIQVNGIVIDPSKHGGVKFAPGYPQAPVI